MIHWHYLAIGLVVLGAGIMLIFHQKFPWLLEMFATHPAGWIPWVDLGLVGVFAMLASLTSFIPFFEEVLAKR